MGPVGQCRALELARVKEPFKEHPEPVLDLGEAVLVASILGDKVGPPAAVAVPPCVLGQERDLAGPVAEPRRVVEEEVRELERAE